MDSYKPKRFEFIKNSGGAYSLGVFVATETYSNERWRFRDFYICAHFIFFGLTIVFYRSQKK